jgi:predicted transcriptional regulator of viral defense system
MDAKHKSISNTESLILTTFIDRGKNWFSVSEADRYIPELGSNAVRIQLKRMVDEGLLMRVQDGVYYIIPYEQNSETSMPDWHLLAEPRRKVFDNSRKKQLHLR